MDLSLWVVQVSRRCSCLPDKLLQILEKQNNHSSRHICLFLPDYGLIGVMNLFGMKRVQTLFILQRYMVTVALIGLLSNSLNLFFSYQHAQVKQLFYSWGDFTKNLKRSTCMIQLFALLAWRILDHCINIDCVTDPKCICMYQKYHLQDPWLSFLMPYGIGADTLFICLIMEDWAKSEGKANDFHCWVFPNLNWNKEYTDMKVC